MKPTTKRNCGPGAGDDDHDRAQHPDHRRLCRAMRRGTRYQTNAAAPIVASICAAGPGARLPQQQHGRGDARAGGAEHTPKPLGIGSLRPDEEQPIR